MQDTTQKVRQLLQPTHDANGWHALIGTLNAAEAAPLLNTALNDEQETRQARGQAAAILGRLQQPSSIPALLKALSSPDPVLRADAADALAHFSALPDAAAEQLIQRLGDEDYLVRERCAATLGCLKHSEALETLERMQNSDCVESNRKAAQDAIAAIRGGA